jgi:hypothetical protein
MRAHRNGRHHVYRANCRVLSMRHRTVAWISALALLAACSADGCGQDDLTFPGDFPTPTAAPTTTCGASGSVCTDGSECCSAVCTTADGVNFTCE